MRILTFKTFTFGCRVNQAESIKIEEDLQKAGFKPAGHRQSPDVTIINSCVVTQKAEKEVRQLVHRLRRENSESFFVVCGCAVNFWQKVRFPKLPVALRQQKRAKRVSLWIKNEEKEKIAQILKEKLAFTPILQCIGVKLLDRYQKSSRLIIKIQDGCNKFCSFCIVPYLRGKPKSKKISQITKEVKEAEKSGIKEVTLSGINLGLFGQDTNQRIPDLLSTLLKKTSIPRISFGSIYPEVINDKLIKLYINDWKRGNGRLCRFFHLPLQSGSEKILKLMGRKYGLKKFKSLVERIHEALPEVLISTDVIVGFPGEGEREFGETYKFLKGTSIFKFHVFRFSPREKTLAFKMEKEWGRVEEKVKKERARMLNELGKKKYQDFLTSLVGQKLRILLLEKKGGIDIGMADNSVLVKFFIKKNIEDKIVSVLIKGTDYPYVIGEASN